VLAIEKQNRIYSGQISLAYAKELKQGFHGNFNSEENAT
jgi:hypothetical protein